MTERKDADHKLASAFESYETGNFHEARRQIESVINEPTSDPDNLERANNLRRMIKTSEWQMRIYFGLLFLGVGILALTIFLPSTVQQAFIYEVVFIGTVCVLPAATYYLFLKMRRPSIFNEFVSNLNRLGLLQRRAKPRIGEAGGEVLESGSNLVSRVVSYLQQFEAIYGNLRFGTDDMDPGHRALAKDLINMRNETEAATETKPVRSVRISDIFRANLLIPLGLATVLSAIGWLLVLQPVWRLQDGTTAPSAIDFSNVVTPLTIAFLGAYFFGAQMLFRRFVRRDLGPNAYLAFAIRIILAVIAVWVIMACFATFKPVEGTGHTAAVQVQAAPEPEATVQTPDDPGAGAETNQNAPDPNASAAAGQDGERVESGRDDGGDFLGIDWLSFPDSLSKWNFYLLFFAFLIGVMPRMLWKVLEIILASIGRTISFMPDFRSAQPLSQLDGLTIWHEVRLEEEDIENVPNMASAEIVDAMLRTQIPAERLISWIDQAILYSVLGPAGTGKSATVGATAAKLRSAGIRNASQFIKSTGNADDESYKSVKAALANDPDAADPIPAFRHSIEIESNFDLVRNWRGI